MAEFKYLDKIGLAYYDEKIKAYVVAADAKVLADSKQYFEDNADRFDAAGVAATKVQELADGAVKANTEAIAKLNGDASTEGSVAKAVADAKALVDADIDAINEDIGNVDDLTTANKTVVGAMEELKAAIGTGGTAAVVAVVARGSTEDYTQVYEVTQGGAVVGTINIPKDLVVESGTVVTDPEGMAAGTYIKLVLANVADPLFINVGSLVDIYVAKADATQVQIDINSNTREISASIVAGSVTATELAPNAVITEKIADKNVTKAKLSAEVQASLDKADVAEQNAKDYADDLDEAMDLRMQAVEAKLTGNGEGTVEEKIAAAKQEAIDHADGLNTAMDERMQAVEGKAHEHANKAELDKIAEGDKAKWDAAQANAEATAAAALSAAKTELEGKITDGDKANKDLINGHGTRLDALEEKVGDGFVEITNEEIDAMFAEA